MNQIGETKTPNAGEWWVRNDDGAIVYICGCDPDGDPVSMDDDEELHNSTLRFFTQEFYHEPLCTGFDWLPVSIDPGESYEFLSEGTVLRPGDEVRQSDGTWLPTSPWPGECVGSRAWLKNLYRRKIEPVAEVWPKWIIADHWSDTAYVRRDSADSNSSYTIGGKKRETKNGEPRHAACSIDSLILHKTWRYVTESEALARVVVDPNDVPLNPVPGIVVATGTVKLTPVQPDDWVEYDPAQITCPRVEIDWLTPRLGESQWGPALLVWSNATWAAQRENWKIRCLRRDLPVQPDDTAAIIAEHTQQVRELTQRIGDLVQQVNERDAVIEGIRTALHVDFI